MKMKHEFVEYLKSIGLKEPFLKKIETIYVFFDEICPDDIEDIFINEHVTEGKRIYKSVLFFSKKYVMEAKQFTGDVDDFDIMPIEGRAEYYQIKKMKYDFAKATQASTAYAKIQFDNRMYVQLRASRENCDHLRQMMKKYVLANLKE